MSSSNYRLRLVSHDMDDYAGSLVVLANGYDSAISTAAGRIVIPGIENGVYITPYAVGSSNEAWTLYYYDLIDSGNGYYPTFRLSITCTVSSENGVANTLISDSHSPIDVFSSPNANSDTNYRAVNGETNGQGHIEIACKANDGLILGVIVDCTSWNCLVHTY
jgi:hypothetical protein